MKHKERKRICVPLPSIVTLKLPTFLETTALQRCKLIYAFEGGLGPCDTRRQRDSHQFPNYVISSLFNRRQTAPTSSTENKTNNSTSGTRMQSKIDLETQRITELQKHHCRPLLQKFDIIRGMESDIKSAVCDIESTPDMLERATSRVIRLSWKEWQEGRQAKKATLAAKGLSAPSRRTTARPEARAALDVS